MDTSAPRRNWRVDWVVAAILIAAAFVLGLLLNPRAGHTADLGKGGGVVDLEERVAELEATVARKGNRRVSVVIYGEISKALMWTDNLDTLGTGDKNAHGVVDNSASPSRLGVEGVAKIAPNWKAGYRIELGVNDTPVTLLDDQVVVRHNVLWIEGSPGRFSLGKTSMATDKITQITTANTQLPAPMLSLAPISTTHLLGFDLATNDLRRNLVRWDSPAFGGFSISASYANGDVAPFTGGINTGFSPDHAFDIALRYAGETKAAGGWRFAAGVGYRDEQFAINSMPGVAAVLLPYVRDTVVSGSASLMNLQTGLFVSGAYAKVEGEVLAGMQSVTGAHLQAGWEKRINSLGATTIYGEWMQLTSDAFGDAKPNVIGFGASQAIDAAAMDIYLSYRQIDLDSGDPKASTILGGMRIKF